MIPVNIDQVEQGLNRNIHHLDKGNYNKLISLFLTEVQKVQDAVIDLSNQKNIATAEGVWLDYIGKIVGEKRLARTDAEYRAAILLKISINSADATPDNITTLLKQLTGSTDTQIIEYPYASFIVSIITDYLLDNVTWNLVDNTKPAGVSAITIHNLDGDRFVPSWIDPDNYELFSEDFILDNGDLLLLDDTLDPNNYLTTDTVVYNSYNDDTYAVLGWDDGVNPVDIRYLAQVITSYTTN